MSEEEVREKYKKLTELLIEKKLEITVMESMTGGLIASFITDTEGSSAIFKGGIVSYSNEAKIKFGVPREVIEKFGVYSEETSCAMAKEAGRLFNADISIGLTGTSGNIDETNSDSKVGKIFICVIFGDKEKKESLQLPPSYSRKEYKTCAASFVVDLVFDLLG